MSKAKEIYAKRLKEARAASGETLKKVGTDAGMDEFVANTRMSRYENAKAAPSMDDALAIAEAMDLPYEYFFCEDDDIAKLLLTLNQLTKAQRHQVYELADLVVSEYI